MRIAFTLFAFLPRPSGMPVDPKDMHFARLAVADELRVKDRHHTRRTVRGMIRHLEHVAWVRRYELLLDGLPIDPDPDERSARARELLDDDIERLTDAQFVRQIQRELRDEIHDRQVEAQGAESFARALRAALSERGMPVPDPAPTRPSSLLSLPPAQAARAF